jgi:cellulose synthase/poly-beta-1,6-N-acetylglucosamine synthase-like glycosyltransferase
MIGTLLGIPLALGSAGLTIPSLTFAVECLLGVSGDEKRAGAAPPDSASVAVLIPAHDEQAGIAGTLEKLAPQLRPNRDQVIVIADNCTDDTANVARRAGATVLERHDSAHRGKGYALSFAIGHLAATSSPPDVVVVLDADCALRRGGLTALVGCVQQTQRPVQADNVLNIWPNAPLRTKISAFAFRVKNLVRPRGLARLGFGRQLAGTGMGFPWDVIRDAPKMQGHITEDLVLGLELALRGQCTVHCPEALVESDIAPSITGQAKQRERWEHGHLSAIREYFPRMMREAVRQGRLELCVLGCDLAVPSLAMLVLMVGSGCVVSTAAVTLVPSVTWIPAAICGANAAIIAIAVGAAWGACGRDLLSSKDLFLGVPGYLLWKMPSYWRLLSRKRATQWVRAERPEEATKD